MNSKSAEDCRRQFVNNLLLTQSNVSVSSLNDPIQAPDFEAANDLSDLFAAAHSDIHQFINRTVSNHNVSDLTLCSPIRNSSLHSNPCTNNLVTNKSNTESEHCLPSNLNLPDLTNINATYPQMNAFSHPNNTSAPVISHQCTSEAFGNYLVPYRHQNGTAPLMFRASSFYTPGDFNHSVPLTNPFSYQPDQPFVPLPLQTQNDSSQAVDIRTSTISDKAEKDDDDEGVSPAVINNDNEAVIVPENEEKQIVRSLAVEDEEKQIEIESDIELNNNHNNIRTLKRKRSLVRSDDNPAPKKRKLDQKLIDQINFNDKDPVKYNQSMSVFDERLDFVKDKILFWSEYDWSGHQQPIIVDCVWDVCAILIWYPSTVKKVQKTNNNKFAVYFQKKIKMKKFAKYKGYSELKRDSIIFDCICLIRGQSVEDRCVDENGEQYSEIDETFIVDEISIVEEKEIQSNNIYRIVAFMICYKEIMTITYDSNHNVYCLKW